MRLRKKTHYNRRAILDAARHAGTRGSLRAAVGHYREVLQVEPDNADLHAKVAPLLLKSGDERGAWDSYIYAGRAYLKDGYDQKALSLFRQTARHFPASARVWDQIADIHLSRGRNKDAANALFEGSAHFRSQRVIELGLRLIYRAFQLQPYRPDISLEYARMLATSGRFPQARRLLRELRAEADRALRRRIAWAEMRLFPGWGTFASFLRETLAL
ncbi:MAG: hypothetical protein IT381_27215 [Deltaproteobacteria bacterium]|nr:hypothetical protein [Deltaproteobacteria bacterium]